MITPIKYVNCNALVKQNNISKYTHNFVYYILQLQDYYEETPIQQSANLFQQVNFS